MAPLRSLQALARYIDRVPNCRYLFTQEEDRTIWQTIQEDPQYAELKTKLGEHLRFYGDRGPEELKLETLGLHEEPHRLIALIHTCRHSTPHTSTGQDTYQQAQAIVDRHLKNPFKKLAFGFVLQQARRAIVSRENMRFARSRLYGIVRRVFGRMADLFVAGGLIDAPSNLYYLTVDEVFGMVQGTSVTRDLKALIQIRKVEYRSFTRRDPSERLHTTVGKTAKRMAFAARWLPGRVRKGTRAGGRPMGR